MAVRELDFTVRTSIRGVTFPLAFFMSPQPLDSSSPLPLEVLRIEYIGSLGLFLGKGNVAAALPRLRTLSFSCTAVHVSQGTDASLPPLSDFSISNGSLSGSVDAPFLPPTTTGVCFAGTGFAQLPRGVLQLPALRRQAGMGMRLAWWRHAACPSTFPPIGSFACQIPIHVALLAAALSSTTMLGAPTAWTSSSSCQSGWRS